jgi:hypothetical protein
MTYEEGMPFHPKGGSLPTNVRNASMRGTFRLPFAGIRRVVRTGNSLARQNGTSSFAGRKQACSPCMRPTRTTCAAGVAAMAVSGSWKAAIFRLRWRTKVSRGKNGTDGCFGQRRDDVQLPSPWQSNMACEGNLSGHGGGRVYGELQCGGRFGIRCSLCSHSHLKP